MFDWNSFFCDLHFIRVSNYRGDYLRIWFLHGDFAVGLYIHDTHTIVDVHFKKNNVCVNKSIEITPLNSNAILSFFKAIDHKIQFPLFVNSWASGIVSAYFSN